MSDNEDITFELKAIKRILSIGHSDKIDAYLNEVIRTTNRKKMWIALDGKRLPIDIAKEAGVSPAAVTFFLQTVTNAEIVEYQQGTPPRKLVDHIPSDWLIALEEE